MNNQRVGNVKQSCEYDSHANPVDCQLIIVDEGVNPPSNGFTPSKIRSIIINAIVRSASGESDPVFCALPDTDAGIYTCEWHYDIDH
ncbi:YnfC family lipoprotein [Escherichia coli]|uniref:YnfC family lipoprotein n=1 Tax=Escherichia coli TaxID=562 RepID=UPI0024C497CA|nr:YnfC family lipoprotein [Escherichia coli]